MSKVSGTVDIKARPRQVFEFLWNCQNLPKYWPVSQVEVLEEGERRIRFRPEFDLGGRKVSADCVQQIAEEGRKITLQGTQGMKMEATWLLQELRDGTRVMYMADYVAPGSILERFRLDKQVNLAFTEGLQKLKSAIEETVSASTRRAA